MPMCFCLACVTYLTVIILRNTSHDSNTGLSYHNCNGTATPSLDGRNQGNVTESGCTIVLICLVTSLPNPLSVAYIIPVINLCIQSVHSVLRSYLVGIITISKPFKINNSSCATLDSDIFASLTTAYMFYDHCVLCYISFIPVPRQ